MRDILFDLTDKGFEEVELVLFYDLHIGSKKCDHQEIARRISYVQNTPNAYAILGGDLINNSTKDSVGDTYTEVCSPMEQCKAVIELFTPIADKIVAMTSGNHERRSYKKEGVDLSLYIAGMLGIQDRYDSAGCLAFIKFGKKTKLNELEKMNGTKTRPQCQPLVYTVYFTHGDGNSGRTIGGKANGLERRGDIIDADVVIAGHTHAPFAMKRAAFKCVPNTFTHVLKEQLLVNAAATLEYEEYAELFGLKPSSSANPRIYLNGRMKETAAVI